jgi:hypothetical protein
MELPCPGRTRLLFRLPIISPENRNFERKPEIIGERNLG